MRKTSAGAGQVADATGWTGVQRQTADAAGPVPQNPPETVRKVTRAGGKAADQDNDQVVNGSHRAVNRVAGVVNGNHCAVNGVVGAVNGNHCVVNGVAGVGSADLGAVGLVADGGRPQVARLMRPMARGAVSNGVEDQGE